MGRERVIKKIKSNAVRMIVLGVITGLLFSFAAFVMFVGKAPELGLFISGMALLMYSIAIIGIVKCVNPMKDRCMKKNPKLLEQADELFSDIIYQDKFIIYSNRIIANAKDITQMAAFDDITRISENSMSYNGIRAEHSIVLVLPNYEIKISVYAKGRNTISELKNNIFQRCPQIVAHYSTYKDRIEL